MKTILIRSLNIFLHKKDGLRLWEAGIILSRYIIKHIEDFSEKNVMELGAGVGIASLALLKFGNPNQVYITDYD